MNVVSLWCDHDVTLRPGSGIQRPVVDTSCASSEEGCVVNAGTSRDFNVAGTDEKSNFYLSYKLDQAEQGKGSKQIMFNIQPDGTLSLINGGNGKLIANLTNDRENHYILNISDNN